MITNTDTTYRKLGDFYLHKGDAGDLKVEINKQQLIEVPIKEVRLYQSGKFTHAILPRTKNQCAYIFTREFIINVLSKYDISVVMVELMGQLYVLLKTEEIFDNIAASDLEPFVFASQNTIDAKLLALDPDSNILSFAKHTDGSVLFMSEEVFKIYKTLVGNTLSDRITLDDLSTLPTPFIYSDLAIEAAKDRLKDLFAGLTVGLIVGNREEDLTDKHCVVFKVPKLGGEFPKSYIHRDVRRAFEFISPFEPRIVDVGDGMYLAAPRECHFIVTMPYCAVRDFTRDLREEILIRPLSSDYCSVMLKSKTLDEMSDELVKKILLHKAANYKQSNRLGVKRWSNLSSVEPDLYDLFTANRTIDAYLSSRIYGGSEEYIRRERMVGIRDNMEVKEHYYTVPNPELVSRLSLYNILPLVTGTDKYFIPIEDKLDMPFNLLWDLKEYVGTKNQTDVTRIGTVIRVIPTERFNK